MGGLTGAYFEWSHYQVMKVFLEYVGRHHQSLSPVQ